MAASFLARAESWYAVIRQAAPDAPVKRTHVRRGLLIGMAGSAVAPGRLGEVARTYVVARHIGELSSTVAVVAGTVIAQTLLNLIALFLLTMGAIAGSTATSVRLAAVIGVVLLPVGLVAGLLLIPALLEKVAAGREGRVAQVASWASCQVRRVRAGVAPLRRPAAALHCGTWQMAAWALQLLTCYVVIQGVGGTPHAPLSAAAAVLVAVNIGAIFPLTPSNIGVFQAACVGALAPFGVHVGEAIACGLILQAVEIFCSLVMGILSLLREGISWGELRRGRLLSSDVPEPSGP
jgi:phosphatidylinositol alpha-mannosyltransferase